jgi:RNA recognition motif-containing protein
MLLVQIEQVWQVRLTHCGTSCKCNIAAFADHILDSDVDDFAILTAADVFASNSESTSIPKNPRTDRPVGYAFVDLSTPSEAERAIAELSGKEILDRKVSVQLARKPEPNAEKGDAADGEAGSGGEGGRRRQTRNRGRGRGRGGRTGRAARGVSLDSSKYMCSVITFLVSW